MPCYALLLLNPT
jgi:NAD(P)-dependent dehydrogenase (short-subunit alcohol dehydrogenase family)